MEKSWWDEYGDLANRVVGGVLDYKMRELELTEGQRVATANAKAAESSGIPSWVILAGGALLVILLVKK